MTGAGKASKAGQLRNLKVAVSWELPVVSFSKTAYIIRSPVLDCFLLSYLFKANNPFKQMVAGTCPHT